MTSYLLQICDTRRSIFKLHKWFKQNGIEHQYAEPVSSKQTIVFTKFYLYCIEDLNYFRLVGVNEMSWPTCISVYEKLHSRDKYELLEVLQP